MMLEVTKALLDAIETAQVSNLDSFANAESLPFLPEADRAMVLAAIEARKQPKKPPCYNPTATRTS